ncbi:nucleotidyltransferase domain-containing protein [Tepidibacter thalassicus]|uniref:Nucleotidyltransferase domain-containing protein n=1 Tax=Tepidibacter thalassicus DSM 15285 TaxID=1123350 RepID=A0A1M5P487_9FIRM|nr:nucleotidyltransferase domain-containing protein [Tepidibacter thalassicus]SHG96634.1 Nucleotidyltransferase domain-containing protein [Tepidibacter thalassicus DSM 15285]
MDIKETFEKQISTLKEDNNNVSIIVVGSNKNLDFDKKINDIDLFVITKEGQRQIREIKFVKGIEFDINYFSIDLSNKFIENKKQFFIEGMSKGNLIYDSNDIGKKYMESAKIQYEKGPKKISLEELNSLKFVLFDNIKRIETLKGDNWQEIEFLSNLYLRDIIRAYFVINKKWIPKDKKLFKVLSETDNNLYQMVQKLYINYDTDILKEMINYIFKDIKIDEKIKIIY